MIGETGGKLYLIARNRKIRRIDAQLSRAFIAKTGFNGDDSRGSKAMIGRPLGTTVNGRASRTGFTA
jgi:hypothetical protein